MDTSSQRSYNTMERGGTPDNSEYRILILGKTGNGKSSLGNAVLEKDQFTTGRSMAPATVNMQEASTDKPGQKVKVVDTPDIINVGDMDTQMMYKEVSRWKQCTSPYPSAILLAVRCDVRYTAEEYDIYRQIKLYWGDDASFCSRLIVAFTFGDCLDNPIEEELKEVCPELKRVLKDANNRYVVSNQKEKQNAVALWKSLVGYISGMGGIQKIPEDKSGNQILVCVCAVLIFSFCIILGSLFAYIVSRNIRTLIVLGVFLGICVLPLAWIVYKKERRETLARNMRDACTACIR